MRIAVLLLVAAAMWPGAAAARRHKPHAAMPIGQSAAYRCANGRSIELLFAGDGTVVLTPAGSEAVTLMPTDRTGAHFQGGGWRWFSSSATTGWLVGGNLAKGVACAVG